MPAHRSIPRWWLAVLAVLVSFLLVTEHASARSGAIRAPKHPLATGTGGAVASMDADASQAGIETLRHGGNAVDAIVATASAMGVTIPFVAGPGGGGFMIVYNAHTHRVTTIDGRETCPAACTSKLFVNRASGKPMDYMRASSQPLSTGVPAMVATWATAVRRFGARSLGADLRPAIRVARRGFRVNRDFVQLERSGLKLLRAYPASRALWLTRRGRPLPVGTVLRNPDLARTYSKIAAHGPSYLYDGPLGRAIVAAVDHPVLTPGEKLVTRPGIMTMRDLRAYRARVKRADLGLLPGAADRLDAAAFERWHDRRRGAEHPVGLPAFDRAACDRAVSLPGGVAAGLRRPRSLCRRPPLRPCAGAAAAEPIVCGDATLSDP